MTRLDKLEQLKQIQALQQQLREKLDFKMQRKQKKVEARQQLAEQLQRELQVCPRCSQMVLHASVWMHICAL